MPGRQVMVNQNEIQKLRVRDKTKLLQKRKSMVAG